MGLFAIVGGAALAAAGWWLLRNWLSYGDPFLIDATLKADRRRFPFDVVPSVPRTVVIEVPRGVWKSFWYTSGWNQFAWNVWWYVPFWLLAFVGVTSVWVRRDTDDRAFARQRLVLTAFALSALAIVWVLALRTVQYQARVAFAGLPAIAILISVGYERLHARLPLRFMLPAVGLVGTAVAIKMDVFDAFAHVLR